MTGVVRARDFALFGWEAGKAVLALAADERLDGGWDGLGAGAAGACGDCGRADGG